MRRAKAEVGATVRLYVRWWEDEQTNAPEEGDFLRTDSGRCYRIDEVRKRKDGRVASLTCTVLEDDAVLPGEPGVFRWEWSSRRRRGAIHA
jgi:hypothetical protein